jgi:hypothetical protein
MLQRGRHRKRLQRQSGLAVWNPERFLGRYYLRLIAQTKSRDTGRRGRR